MDLLVINAEIMYIFMSFTPQINLESATEKQLQD